MNRKRSSIEEREHILRKIKKLEERVINLPPDSDEEELDNQQDQENKSPDDEEQLLQGFISEEEEKQEILEDEVLNILGIVPEPQPKKEILRKEIAERWTGILEKGLKKEDKEEITKLNTPFENCRKMVAPKLNKEVSAALNENAKKRDTLIEIRQKQISSSLACLGHAMHYCLAENMQENKLNIIKKINDAARLLCDALYLDSRGRRTLVLSTINKNLKESLQETEPGEFLFGENLLEKIKTAKAVQKSGKDLKTPNIEEKKKKQDTEKKKTLNWRGPPRTLQPRKPTGGPAAYQQRKKDFTKPPKR